MDYDQTVFKKKVIELTPDDHFDRCLFLGCAFHGYGAEFVSCKLVGSRQSDTNDCNFVDCVFVIM